MNTRMNSMEKDMANMEQRLTIRLGGIMAVGIGVLIAIMVLFQFGLN